MGFGLLLWSHSVLEDLSISILLGSLLALYFVYSIVFFLS